MSNEKFVPHKNVLGAVRLKLARADNSGTVNSDPMFMVDRQAIINHVMAYSYLIDEGRWDDWFALFSDDVEASNSTPELGTVTTRGSDTAFTWTLGGGADSIYAPLVSPWKSGFHAHAFCRRRSEPAQICSRNRVHLWKS